MIWRKISSAPRCVASTAHDGGYRPVLVTRWPYTGHAAPIFIAAQTSSGWKKHGGGKLPFEPTHWRRMPRGPSSFRQAIGVWVSMAKRWGALFQRKRRGACLLSAPVGKVRLHPLPEGASQPLASVIGAAVAGAVRDCVNKHDDQFRLSKHQFGLLVGSVRKRAVNQLVCPEGESRIRRALQ